MCIRDRSPYCVYFLFRHTKRPYVLFSRVEIQIEIKTYVPRLVIQGASYYYIFNVVFVYSRVLHFSRLVITTMCATASCLFILTIWLYYYLKKVSIYWLNYSVSICKLVSLCLNNFHSRSYKHCVYDSYSCNMCINETIFFWHYWWAVSYTHLILCVEM